MCGIFGVLFKKDGDAPGEMSAGLRRILNRGYDSIGVSFLEPTRILKTYRRDMGDPMNEMDALLTVADGGRNAIGHTRWATHGEVNLVNCHPHSAGRFIMVHNGIVENQDEFDSVLMEAGVRCVSDTDSERIVQMIALETIRLDGDVESAIAAVAGKIRGGFAIVIQDTESPDRIYCMRRENPLLVGERDDALLVCSEKNGLVGCGVVMEISPDRLVVMRRGNVLDTESGVVLPERRQELSDILYDFTENELRQQPDLWRSIINERCHPLRFQEIPESLRDTILSHKHLMIVGCGTSYHASITAATWFRRYRMFETVQAHDAVDFDLGIIPSSPACWIFISQSGETLDLSLLHDRLPPGSLCVGFYNVVGSLLWRKCPYNIYTMAGEEKGVASTKSFSCQILHLYLFALWLARDEIPADLHYTPDMISNLFYRFPLLEEWTDRLYRTSSLLILGRQSGYHAALESALKITELSRIHSDAFSSGSLKHGPFALLDATMPVIFIHTSDVPVEKTILSVREILSRGASVFLLYPSHQEIRVDHPNLSSITYPDITGFRFLCPIILLQELAIMLCKKRGFSVDYPRNLAKTVTVE